MTLGLGNEPKTHWWEKGDFTTTLSPLLQSPWWSNCLVIPTPQRVEYLRDLHAGHLGEEKNLLRAQKTVFWPGILNDIRNAVKACAICQEHKSAQQKEPIMPQMYLACHGSSLESKYWMIVPITTYWLQIISVNFLLWRNFLTRHQVTWSVSSRQSLQNMLYI